LAYDGAEGAINITQNNPLCDFHYVTNNVNKLAFDKNGKTN